MLRPVTTTTKEKRELIDSARDIAYSMISQGTVTIKDVIARMKKLGMPTEMGNNTWRGGIFKRLCWIKVGRTASDLSSHGRSLLLYMHKSIVDKLKVFDGTAYSMSRYNLTEIYGEFMKLNKKVSRKNCLWVIGKDTLYHEFLTKIKSNKDHTLYGIKVKLVPGVGAMLTSNPKTIGG